MLAKILAHAVDKMGERNGRGVGGDDRAGLAVLVDLAVQRLLDFKVFNNDLDHKIALGKPLQVILNIARPDSFGIALVHQRRWVGFQHSLDSAFCDRVPVRPFLGEDIEQDYVYPGVGRLGGNARTHDT